MSLENDFLKVKTTPELENKIHIDIKNTKEKIHWYIKFNLMLDEQSVSSKTMFVTDKEGYILKTDISYRVAKNLIVISPLEDYIEGVYYILTITKEVRSAGNNNLKNDIHILFKINKNRVEDYIILPPNVVVPEPRLVKRRKVEAKPKKQNNTKLYSFNKYIDDKDMAGKLPIVDIIFNPLIGVLGVILTIISLFLQNVVFMGISGVVALLGIIHIVYQLTRAKVRSDFAYNKGVRRFNADRFLEAEAYFNKALKINPDNEYAEYAKGKMSYYKE